MTARPIKIAFVGEAPNVVDGRVLPFADRVGQRLDGWVALLGLSANDVYFCDVNTRTLLARQLLAVRPQIIVTLGLVSAQGLLGSGRTITSLRAGWQDWRGFPVRCTYHPAYIDRVPSQEQEVFKDLAYVKSWMRDPRPF